MQPSVGYGSPPPHPGAPYQEQLQPWAAAPASGQPVMAAPGPPGAGGYHAQPPPGAPIIGPLPSGATSASYMSAQSGAPATNGGAVYNGAGPPTAPSSGGGSGASSAPTYAFGARPKAPLSVPPTQAFSSAASGAASGRGGGAAAAAAGPPRPGRARLGPALAATCPMLCAARTDAAGGPDALPLALNNLQFDALVYVSQAFVKVCGGFAVSGAWGGGSKSGAHLSAAFCATQHRPQATVHAPPCPPHPPPPATSLRASCAPGR
jgi:hypothetical protein